MQHRLRAALVPAVALASLALGAVQFRTQSAVALPERLDELSAKRPAAASDLATFAPYGIAEGAEETAAGAAYARLAEQQLGQWLAALDAQQAEQSSVAASGSSRGTGGSAGGSASGGFLDCTKQRESHGDYGAVSGSGSYRGAYQFAQSTWNNTAEYAGRSDLVGADPATVAPADQDAMAQTLYDWQGSAPWGGRC